MRLIALGPIGTQRRLSANRSGAHHDERRRADERSAFTEVSENPLDVARVPGRGPLPLANDIASS